MVKNVLIGKKRRREGSKAGHCGGVRRITVYFA
jgi:hypothetical protein